MLASVGFCLLTVCFISQSSALTSFIALSRDYGDVPPRQVLAANMRAVLEGMSSLQAVHPRLSRLYALLKKDLHPSSLYAPLNHVLDLSRALQPSYYDVNKLNRVFTTTTGWPAA